MARYGSDDDGSHLFTSVDCRTDGSLSPVRMLHIWLCVLARSIVTAVVSIRLHIEINCAVFGFKFYCARNRFPIVLITHYTANSASLSHLLVRSSSLALFSLSHSLRCEPILSCLLFFGFRYLCVEMCALVRCVSGGSDDDDDFNCAGSR